MMLLCCASSLVLIYLVYKLIDRLLRRSLIGHYDDRYIVLTGCDSGFGQAAARRLDQLGCHVFAGCLTESGQQQLTNDCSDKLDTFLLDVTDHNSVLKALDFVKSKLPRGKGLWGVVNNAGVASAICPPEFLTLDIYRRVLAVNTLGLIDVTMTFLPLIKQSRGRIVNMASIHGRHSSHMLLPYCVSKYGVEAFTDGLRRSVRPYGCQAVLIEPGYTKTSMISADNIRRYIDDSWNGASTDIKQEFGDDYPDKLFSKTFNDIEMMTRLSDISDVVDAYIHALLGRYPRARYVVGLDANYIFLPIQWLPEWIGDWIVEILNSDAPVAAVLKKQL